MRNRAAIAALCLLGVVGTSAVLAQGIQQWRTPDGKLYFGDFPPPGSTLVGATESLGTSGGGDVHEGAESAQSKHHWMVTQALTMVSDPIIVPVDESG